MEENELHLYYQLFAKINQDTRFQVVYTFVLFKRPKEGMDELGAEIAVTKGYIAIDPILGVFNREEYSMIQEFFTKTWCLEDGEKMAIEYIQGASGVLHKHPHYGQMIYGGELWLSRDEHGRVTD